MFKSILNCIINALPEGYKNSEEREEDLLLMGDILTELKQRIWESDKPFSPDTWDEFGYKIFSQSNEDGLIQYLIRKVEIPNKTLVLVNNCVGDIS